jgi:hypothetical protein
MEARVTHYHQMAISSRLLCRLMVKIKIIITEFEMNLGKSGYNIVKEGISSILIPNTGEIFYNPVQEFNRDLSVLVVKTFQERYLIENPLLLVAVEHRLRLLFRLFLLRLEEGWFSNFRRSYS